MYWTSEICHHLNPESLHSGLNKSFLPGFVKKLTSHYPHYCHQHPWRGQQPLQHCPAPPTCPQTQSSSQETPPNTWPPLLPNCSSSSSSLCSASSHLSRAGEVEGAHRHQLTLWPKHPGSLTHREPLPSLRSSGWLCSVLSLQLGDPSPLSEHSNVTENSTSIGRRVPDLWQGPPDLPGQPLGTLDLWQVPVQGPWGPETPESSPGPNPRPARTLPMGPPTYERILSKALGDLRPLSQAQAPAARTSILSPVQVRGPAQARTATSGALTLPAAPSPDGVGVQDAPELGAHLGQAGQVCAGQRGEDLHQQLRWQLQQRAARGLRGARAPASPWRAQRRRARLDALLFGVCVRLAVGRRRFGGAPALLAPPASPRRANAAEASAHRHAVPGDSRGAPAAAAARAQAPPWGSPAREPIGPHQSRAEPRPQAAFASRPRPPEGPAEAPPLEAPPTGENSKTLSARPGDSRAALLASAHQSSAGLLSYCPNEYRKRMSPTNAERRPLADWECACGQQNGAVPRVRAELTTSRAWDWRTPHCSSEARGYPPPTWDIFGCICPPVDDPQWHSQRIPPGLPGDPSPQSPLRGHPWDGPENLPPEEPL